MAVEDGASLTALGEFGECSDEKKPKKRVRAEVREPSQRRCGRCNGTGHNARKCKKVVEVNSERYKVQYRTIQGQCGPFGAIMELFWSAFGKSARPAREVRYKCEFGVSLRLRGWQYHFKICRGYLTVL